MESEEKEEKERGDREREGVKECECYGETKKKRD